MNLHVDLGQMIIASLIAIVGYFLKKEITNFADRLDKHESIIFGMAQNIATVVGQVTILNKLVGLNDRVEAIELQKIIGVAKR